MWLFIFALPSDKRGRMPPSSRSRHHLDYLIRSCHGYLDHHGYHHNQEQHQHLDHQVATPDSVGLLDLSRGANCRCNWPPCISVRQLFCIFPVASLSFWRNQESSRLRPAGFGRRAHLFNDAFLTRLLLCCLVCASLFLSNTPSFQQRLLKLLVCEVVSCLQAGGLGLHAM